MRLRSALMLLVIMIATMFLLDCKQSTRKKLLGRADGSAPVDQVEDRPVAAPAPGNAMSQPEVLGECAKVPLGFSFPPLKFREIPSHSVNQIQFTCDHAKALGVTRIRFGEDWKIRETRSGSYNWSTLDSRIDYLEKQNIAIMLTVQSNGPSRACGKSNETSCVFTDLSGFEHYVSALVSRYRGRVKRYQFGNEMLSPHFYAGTPDDFILAANRFYDTVKQTDPAADIVLGGFSVGAIRRMAVCDGGEDIPINYKGTWVDASTRSRYCGKDWIATEVANMRKLLAQVRYDTIDLHLYDDAEYWPKMYAAFRRLAPGKPILISEFGGPNLAYEPYTDEYHAERVRVYLDAISKLDGLLEAYYFRLVETKSSSRSHMKSSLFGPPPAIAVKPAYDAFKDYAANACGGA